MVPNEEGHVLEAKVWISSIQAKSSMTTPKSQTYIKFLSLVQAIRELLGTYPGETSPGELLRAVGHCLATAVGGASGPLYGTAFIEAGLVAGSQPELEWTVIGRMLDEVAAATATRDAPRTWGG